MSNTLNRDCSSCCMLTYRAGHLKQSLDQQILEELIRMKSVVLSVELLPEKFFHSCYNVAKNKLNIPML